MLTITNFTDVKNSNSLSKKVISFWKLKERNLTRTRIYKISKHVKHALKRTTSAYRKAVTKDLMFWKVTTKEK